MTFKPHAVLVLLTGWAASSACAQTETQPQLRPLVVTTKPSDAQVSAALAQVKDTILPRVWSPKCEQKAADRRKYLKKWQAVVSEHYIVFTNGPTTSCKKYGVTLEKLYTAMQKELPFQDPKNLLVAYIFAKREDYYRYSVNITGFSEAGARATAGHAMSHFYATYYSSPRNETVYHEAAHEIVGACLKTGGVGSWFQEGMAVYFENKMTNGRLDASCRSEIKRGACYPLEEFFALPSLLGDPNGHGRRNYEHAGALINFMINTKQAPVAGKFTEFLAASRRGYGFARGGRISAQLIKKVYGLEVGEFEDVWRKHLRLKPRAQQP